MRHNGRGRFFEAEHHRQPTSQPIDSVRPSSPPHQRVMLVLGWATGNTEQLVPPTDTGTDVKS